MINTKCVSFSYRGMDAVLRNITVHEGAGHCLALLGNNGAGKSTFLKCLNRILPAKDGVIEVDGINVKNAARCDIAKRMAYVEQHTHAERLTVYDTVLLGRKPHIKFAPTDEDYKIVEAAIERMHLKKLSLRYVDELSGGELQKVALARALAQQPRVLLLDEPTASLDLCNQHEVMKVVSDIAHQDNILVVVVIHDLNLALKYCDRFMLISDGEVYSYGDSSTVTEKAISEVYGVDTTVADINGNKVVVVC
ncbi:ABC transporter ATP-binding protein [Butyrivibrio proteoclasticus]|uniref:ABC transporter ATP-binding protein n=1 Tax=Butyrivibrio proteoclasticus TaxID=43305 RepID=UPI00047CF365|nr:ABC transporter ATP-binding protein [Butyrivibrio proteoclasticus]